MSQQEYEHAVRKSLEGQPSNLHQANTPREAGERYREAARQVEKYGGKAELLRRPVAPWEVVERCEQPNP